jgi:hypothetical protein
MTSRRISWVPTLEHATEIVDGYDTGVTLSQLSIDSSRGANRPRRRRCDGPQPVRGASPPPGSEHLRRLMDWRALAACRAAIGRCERIRFL